MTSICIKFEKLHDGYIIWADQDWTRTVKFHSLLIYA